MGVNVSEVFGEKPFFITRLKTYRVDRVNAFLN